jgi:hypothetical protein
MVAIGPERQKQGQKKGGGREISTMYSLVILISNCKQW